MTQIGTKFRYVFKLHRSDFHSKISHRIQHTFSYRDFKNLNILTFTIFFNDSNRPETLVCFCYFFYIDLKKIVGPVFFLKNSLFKIILNILKYILYFSSTYFITSANQNNIQLFVSHSVYHNAFLTCYMKFSQFKSVCGCVSST